MHSLGDSVFIQQDILSSLINKLYKLTKPKSIFEKIIDWIKDRIIKKAINNLIKKMFDNCPFVQYFKERLAPKFKEIKTKLINKLKTIFRGVRSMLRLGFKIARKIIGGIWKVLKKVFTKALNAIFKSIKAVLNFIYKIARGLGKMLWNAIKAVYKFFKKIF